MERRYELYLKDILEQIRVIREFTEGYDFEDFRNDRKTIYAVTRALEIIGEAVANISNEVKEKYPEVPWESIKRFRNVIVHKY